MASDVEPAKKVLLPYLQRADELQKHEPLVAYYCRLYGMECGLKIPVKERTKTTNTILISLMNQLEKDKKSIQLHPEDNLYVEGFALNVFAKADKQDRAGRADLNTAKTFYAASIFIEILHQFGPLQPDIEQKQKYAVWKAADIRKALSEGRKPVSGPPGGDDQSSMPPHQSIDSVVRLDNTADGGLEGRLLYVRQASNAVETGSTSLDGESKTSISEPSQPVQHDHYGSATDHHDYYSSATDHGMPQQPPFDFSHSGHIQTDYSSSYPSSYHPDDMSAPSPSMSASPRGSISQMDAYNSRPHSAHYQQYAQVAPSGHMYPSLPTTYIDNNGSPDAPYYQMQSHVLSNVAYPVSVPFSADYSSFPGSSVPSGLGQTASVPINPVEVHAYQPTPEKIAEAQKAARFAVSALAFDDVPTALSYLKQSLELLTSPPT